MPTSKEIFDDAPPKARRRKHSDVKSQATATANDAISRAQSQSQSAIAQTQAYIAKVAESRQNAIEQASDVIAMLHDPGLFQAEAIALAGQKMQSRADMVELFDPYEGLTFDAGILPDTAIGALPY